MMTKLPLAPSDSFPPASQHQLTSTASRIDYVIHIIVAPHKCLFLAIMKVTNSFDWLFLVLYDFFFAALLILQFFFFNLFLNHFVCGNDCSCLCHFFSFIAVSIIHFSLSNPGPFLRSLLISVQILSRYYFLRFNDHFSTLSAATILTLDWLFSTKITKFLLVLVSHGCDFILKHNMSVILDSLCLFLGLPSCHQDQIIHKVHRLIFDNFCDFIQYNIIYPRLSSDKSPLWHFFYLLIWSIRPINRLRSEGSFPRSFGSRV